MSRAIWQRGRIPSILSCPKPEVGRLWGGLPGSFRR